MGNVAGSGIGRGAVDFLTKFTGSDQFDKVFKEGMGLVEETANYLDGPGRADSKLLDRSGAIAYATESMRLTTRLMQLASWLLLQRAVNEGELTVENARTEKEKVKFSATPDHRGGPGFAELPERLRTYIAQGDRLFERVQQFDKLERGGIAEAAPAASEGSIGDQLARLRAAFGRLQG